MNVFALILIRMHFHDQRYIFSHNTFEWVQHGDPIGLHILQEFKTFGLQNFSKLAKFNELFKIVCKE
jgi:hypothetical protein